MQANFQAGRLVFELFWIITVYQELDQIRAHKNSFRLRECGFKPVGWPKQSPVGVRLAHDLAHPRLRGNQPRLRKIDHNGNCRGQSVRNAISCSFQSLARTRPKTSLTALSRRHSQPSCPLLCRRVLDQTGPRG